MQVENLLVFVRLCKIDLEHLESTFIFALLCQKRLDWVMV